MESGVFHIETSPPDPEAIRIMKNIDVSEKEKKWFRLLGRINYHLRLRRQRLLGNLDVYCCFKALITDAAMAFINLFTTNQFPEQLTTII